MTALTLSQAFFDFRHVCGISPASLNFSAIIKESNDDALSGRKREIIVYDDFRAIIVSNNRCQHKILLKKLSSIICEF